MNAKSMLVYAYKQRNSDSLIVSFALTAPSQKLKCELAFLPHFNIVWDSRLKLQLCVAAITTQYSNSSLCNLVMTTTAHINKSCPVYFK